MTREVMAEKLMQVINNLIEITNGSEVRFLSLAELFNDPERDGLVFFAGDFFSKQGIFSNLSGWVETELLPAMKESEEEKYSVL